MQPALRQYLTKLREEAYVELKPGVIDTGSSGNEMRLTYSAYTPPPEKKKKKFVRSRFRGKKPSAPVQNTQTASKAPAAVEQQRPGRSTSSSTWHFRPSACGSERPCLHTICARRRQCKHGPAATPDG